MAAILIVDDEPSIRELIRFSLKSSGFSILEAGHADEAREVILAERPDLVLLDWMLPGRSGAELARELKQNPKTRKLPIIMLTARGEEADKIEGFDAGVDDYVTKPFSPLELEARIKAVLRRSSREEDECLEAKGMRLDTLSHRVTVNGKALDLSPTEFKLLHFFMAHPDRAFTRAQLLDQVWGDNVYVEERTVDVHVRRLRKELEPSGHHTLIHTVRGVGYRFSPPE